MPSQLSAEDRGVERVYIGGYQDGSVRIWDATLPVLSLICILEGEVTKTCCCLGNYLGVFCHYDAMWKLLQILEKF